MKKIKLLFVVIIIFSTIQLAFTHKETLLDYYRAMTSASSVLVERGRSKEFYAPWKTIDGNLKTSWVEGKRDEGIGEYINIRIGNISREIVAIEIFPGVAATKKLFKMNNRPKNIEVILYDEWTDYRNKKKHYREFYKYTFVLKNEYRFQKYDLIDIDEIFKKYKENVKLRIIIKSVYRGTKYNDTAISEIRLIEKDGRDVSKVARELAIETEKRTKDHVTPR